MTRKPLNAEAYSAYVWYKRLLNDAMWMALGIGLFLGIGFSVGIIALTQSWFGWGW